MSIGRDTRRRRKGERVVSHEHPGVQTAFSFWQSRREEVRRMEKKPTIKGYDFEEIGEGVLHRVAAVRIGQFFYCMDCSMDTDEEPEAVEITGYEEELKGLEVYCCKCKKKIQL
jgi:hypothetical protein